MLFSLPGRKEENLNPPQYDMVCLPQYHLPAPSRFFLRGATGQAGQPEVEKLHLTLKAEFFLSIFPLVVFGKVFRNSTYFGIIEDEIFELTS